MEDGDVGEGDHGFAAVGGHVLWRRYGSLLCGICWRGGIYRLCRF